MAAVCALTLSTGVKAAGWPANYPGVMLQGFYWDSYKGSDNTRWSTLTSKADELSQYFNIIWIPNSARANGENGGGNGYMPIYWFSNHNCAFGSEAELKNMISTFKAKGVGFIEDVVVNHRVGVSNWYDFPTETWKGKTYQLTNGAICSSDEMWREGGHGCPYTRGNADTGEDFGGARDLDHTNATVQDHIKDYCKFLIDELGYVGFRLDMVKGYSGQYTKIYNQYSKPQFSVGEYWDGNYDNVANWIEATGRESAAFDFPFKYQVNQAFSSNDLTKLCWTNPSKEWQPAGMVHYGYQQYAVTFIDNHDTYRDGSKFTGNVLAANAFMLCSPGTPCVFWVHYSQNKTKMQELINVRKQVGVHNMSAVKVLKVTKDCYLAEVTGTNGKLIVRIGSTSDAPTDPSYTLKCSGTGYSVWATTQGGVTPSNPGGDDTSYPSSLYLMGHINGYAWSTDKGVEAKGNKGTYTWPNITIDDSGDGYGYISFSTTLGSTWDDVNSKDRYGATSEDEPIALGQSSYISCYYGGGDAGSCKSWKLAKGTYSITADLSASTIKIAAPGTTPDPVPGEYPDKLYLIGDAAGFNWATDKGLEASNNNGVYSWKNVQINDSYNGSGYFTFVTVLGSNWSQVNAGDRYGATSSDQLIAAGQTAAIKKFAKNENASAALSWMIDAGSYDITANLAKEELSISKASSSAVDSFENDEESPAIYFNLQGIPVENPEKGIYIMVRGDKVTKIIL